MRAFLLACILSTNAFAGSLVDIANLPKHRINTTNKIAKELAWGDLEKYFHDAKGYKVYRDVGYKLHNHRDLIGSIDFVIARDSKIFALAKVNTSNKANLKRGKRSALRQMGMFLIVCSQVRCDYFDGEDKIELMFPQYKDEIHKYLISYKGAKKGFLELSVGHIALETFMLTFGE